ncbi:hypothetical protein KEM55_005055 [Ascosphaera atra]|nr:hypothetical protein KEM55_005055 [Ascosphaera atra]
MAPSNEASRVRSRRSFAQMPRRDVDGENTTSDVGAISKSQADEAAQRKRDKKLRSKSLGPGGLDALKPRTNDRRKSTLQFPLKSILKPQVPVSPVQNIPTFEETRRRTPGKTPQRARQSLNPGTGDLINFFSPGNTETDPQGNPFDSFSPVGIPLRTEEEQQAAAREREEREKREQEKKSILEQREARRKSLANRRVSFAPEATLHTWNVVEANEDSTTSSAANSTRRASQIGSETAEPQAASSDPAEASDTPTTPENHGMDTSTPESQHARQNADVRRASGVSLNTEENEAFSSSPYGSAVDERESTNIVDENEEDGSESDSDPGDTVMSMDNVTETSHASSSQDSTAKLEENLRKAAQEAGTKGIDHDENGDLSMEFTEIQGAFQPWIKKGASAKFDDMTTTFTQKDLAFEQPLADAGPAGSEATDDEGDLNNTGEMSMDMTNALGQISRRQEDEYSDEAKTPPGNTPDQDRTQATIGQDQTMEFTNVVGGIAENAGNEEPESSPFKPVPSEGDEAADEGTTMELTTVFGGGVINKGRQWDDFEAEDDQQSNADTTEYTQNTNYGDDDMEMTRPMGGILSTIEEQTEPQEDINFTVGMDMTNAIGKILPTQPTIHEEASSLFSRDSFSRGSNQRRQSVTSSSVVPHGAV